MSYQIKLENDKYTYAGLLIMYKSKDYAIEATKDQVSKTPRVLLVQTRRPYLKDYRLTAEIPGGKSKRNEEPIQTVIREIKEELNLDFDVKEINFVISRKTSKHLYHFFSYITEDMNIYQNLYKISCENYQKAEILSVQDVSIYLDKNIQIYQDENSEKEEILHVQDISICSDLRSLICYNSLLSSGSLYEVDFIFILYRLGILSGKNLELCIEAMSRRAKVFAKQEFVKLQKLVD